jgi:membrane fusion protein
VGEQLFRKEAIEAQQVRWLGEIVLIRPLSFSVLTLLATLMASVVVGFLFYGTYTKRSTVSGLLLPEGGQIKVHAPQSGIVVEKLVSEGQHVKQGEPLLRLSSERFGTSAAPLQATISQRLLERSDSLKEELNKTRLLHEEERLSLASGVASLSRELAILAQQSSSQHSLVALADDASRRYKGLLEKGYIATDQFQQRQAELLGQRQTLHSLERERTALQQQLQERQNELAALPSRQANQLAQIERQLASIGQDMAQNEAQRSLIIPAPATGVVSTVLVEIGQSVDSSRTLLSILPEASQLQANLYAPSRAMGFIQPGDQVQIRYQAYPYQKFGQYRGHVELLSRTAVTPDELNSVGGQVPQLAASGESLYRLSVRLQEQSVQAYGVAQPLHSGMLLEADILQERRRLFEWVMEPLYSLTGKL